MDLSGSVPADLRGNSDHLQLLETLVQLETQLCQSTRDIDTIGELQKLIEQPAKTDTVRKLKIGEIVVPEPIQVAELPDIDWSKYDTENVADSSTAPVLNSTNQRTKNLWSKEEQKRLETLLVEYPTERVEMHRFAKIAKALGTRTTKQVASRCQKYFKSLYLAGLPVPGRLPKSSKHVYGSRFDKLNRPGTSSSFFPSFDLPVEMDEESSDGEDLKDTTRERCESVRMISEPKHFPENVPFQQHILSLLGRLKEDKIRSEKIGTPDSLHFNYSCFRCEDRPINGTRWECQTCENVNFCTDCLVAECTKPIDFNQHPVHHEMVGLVSSSRLPTRRVKLMDNSGSESSPESTYTDEDYNAGRLHSTRSYLDPNHPSVL